MIRCADCQCTHRYHERGNGSGRGQMRFDECPRCHHP